MSSAASSPAASAARDDGRFDDALTAVARSAGSIDCLLASFMGFLDRKTDFFCVLPDAPNADGAASGPSGGFPPPPSPLSAEARLLAAFRARRLRPWQAARPTPSPSPPPSRAAAAATAPAPTATAAAASAVSAAGPLRVVRQTPGGAQVPTGNGGASSSGLFWWTQTLHEVTLFVLLPASLAAPGASAKAITVQLSGAAPAQRLRVSAAGADVLSAALGGGVRADHDAYGAAGAAWSWDRDPASAAGRPVLAGAPAPAAAAGTLALHFDKCEETWWRCALRGGPAADDIDVTLVDSTRDVSDYDAETASAIRRVVYEQAHGTPQADIAAGLAARAAASDSE